MKGWPPAGKIEVLLVLTLSGHITNRRSIQFNYICGLRDIFKILFTIQIDPQKSQLIFFDKY